MLSLLLLWLMVVSAEGVYVDGEHVTEVQHPSTRCQDHARGVCEESPGQQLGTVQRTYKNYTATFNCRSTLDVCPMANSSCQLEGPPPPLVHYQYQNNSKGRFNVVLTWKPVNVPCVTGYRVLLWLTRDKKTCDSYLSFEYCVVAVLPKNSTRLVLTEIKFADATARPYAFKVVAYPVYEWPAVLVPSLVTDFSTSSDTCSMDTSCARAPAPPPNLTVTGIPGAAAANVSWELSSSRAHYYMHLKTPLRKFLFVVKMSNFVAVKNLTENGNYSVSLETYECGCSPNSTAPVHFYVKGTSVLPISPSANHSGSSTVISSSLSITPTMVTESPSVGPVRVDPAVVAAAVVVAILVVAGVLVAVIVFVAVVSKLRKGDRKPQHKEQPYSLSPSTLPPLSPTPPQLPPTPPPTPPSPPPPQPKVVLVYAPDSPKSDEEVIVALSYQMKKEGISAICYDVACRLDRVRWLEQAASSAQAVLCVVNKQFLSGWGTETAPILSALRLLITADIKQHGAHRGSKFAVLLLSPSDHQFIPDGYMMTLQEFLVTDLRNIIRYTMRIPEYSAEQN